MAKTPDERILKSVNKRDLSPSELERILKQVEKQPPQKKYTFKDMYEKNERIGIISDTHIGHEKFDEGFFKYMGKTMQKEKVSRIYHAGDLLEGMSGRQGQVYELKEIGFTQQINKAEELFKKHLKGIDIFGINGNHDEWYMKKNNGGVDVSQELSNRLENYHHLGNGEADIKIGKGKTALKLFHPNDGTAYAISYKMQKLVNSLSGGEKPNILIQGHYHKAMYMFIRNIHALEAGTLMGQSEWMRRKKIPAHKGFWILDIELGKGGIGKFSPTLYPGYK